MFGTIFLLGQTRNAPDHELSYYFGHNLIVKGAQNDRET